MEKQHMCDCDMIHEKIVEDTRGRMQAEGEYLDLASLFKMFGDGTRVKILHALELNEMCVCDLAALLGMTKSAISHQLKALRLSNLVKSRRDGQVIYYSLADDHVKYILDIGFDHIHHD
jgi:DNA-binding transcriptional ArsR family regulator